MSPIDEAIAELNRETSEATNGEWQLVELKLEGDKWYARMRDAEGHDVSGLAYAAGSAAGLASIAAMRWLK